VINRKPSPASCKRLPSHIHLWDGWGEGFGAWGLVCGARDQRGAAVPAPPWHLRPMRNRPPSCCGARADGPWLRCPRHTHGGKEVGPNRADARIESTLRCRGLPGRRLMHGRGLPGPMHEGVDIIREQKTKNNDNHNKTLFPTKPR
jgi:hypothetical protein